MELIYRGLWILLVSTYMLFSQDIKYFLGYTVGESGIYSNNGTFLMEVDNNTLNLVDKFKKNLWINRLESYIVKGYYKVYYKNEKKIYAEYIKTIPFTYKYGKVYKPKNFKELSIKRILKYNEDGQLIQDIDKSTNSVSRITYSEYMIENEYSIDNKVLNISKSYYKEFCFDNKKLEEFISSSCIDRLKLIVGTVIFNETKEIVSYVIYKYKPFRQILTYDKNGKLNEYPQYGKKNVKSISKIYFDLNLTEEWQYIKKIDKLNGR